MWQDRELFQQRPCLHIAWILAFVQYIVLCYPGKEYTVQYAKCLKNTMRTGSKVFTVYTPIHIRIKINLQFKKEVDSTTYALAYICLQVVYTTVHICVKLKCTIYSADILNSLLTAFSSSYSLQSIQV